MLGHGTWNMEPSPKCVINYWYHERQTKIVSKRKKEWAKNEKWAIFFILWKLKLFTIERPIRNQLKQAFTTILSTCSFIHNNLPREKPSNWEERLQERGGQRQSDSSLDDGTDQARIFHPENCEAPKHGRAAPSDDEQVQDLLGHGAHLRRLTLLKIAKGRLNEDSAREFTSSNSFLPSISAIAVAFTTTIWSWRICS